MTWFKVDDQLAFNSKVMLAGNEAMGLWVRAGSWASAQLTDGFIPDHMANAMAGGMASECGADALVEAGLWERADGGYQFHDWDDFQPSAAAEREKRKKRSEAGRLGAEARWGGKADGKRHDKPHADGMANEQQTDAPSRPDPSRPEEAKASSSRRRETRLPDDWAPTAAHYGKAREKGLDVASQAENFRLHAQTHDRRAVNWNAAFTMWLKKAEEFTGRPQQRPLRSVATSDQRVADIQALKGSGGGDEWNGMRSLIS